VTTVLHYRDTIASLSLQTRLAKAYYIDFVEGLQKYFESCNTASTKRKLSLLIFDSILNIVADMTMITSLNMRVINCRCSPTRVINSSILYMYNSQKHMHMNASISLSIKLNIRLMLFRLPTWRRKTEFGITFHISVFLHACRPTSIGLMRTIVIMLSFALWSC